MLKGENCCNAPFLITQFKFSTRRVHMLGLSESAYLDEALILSVCTLFKHIYAPQPSLHHPQNISYQTLASLKSVWVIVALWSKFWCILEQVEEGEGWSVQGRRSRSGTHSFVVIFSCNKVSILLIDIINLVFPQIVDIKLKNPKSFVIKPYDRVILQI